MPEFSEALVTRCLAQAQKDSANSQTVVRPSNRVCSSAYSTVASMANGSSPTDFNSILEPLFLLEQRRNHHRRKYPGPVADSSVPHTVSPVPPGDAELRTVRQRPLAIAADTRGV